LLAGGGAIGKPAAVCALDACACAAASIASVIAASAAETGA
jgi:hypothetical protein